MVDSNSEASSFSELARFKEYTIRTALVLVVASAALFVGVNLYSQELDSVKLLLLSFFAIYAGSAALSRSETTYFKLSPYILILGYLALVGYEIVATNGPNYGLLQGPFIITCCFIGLDRQQARLAAFLIVLSPICAFYFSPETVSMSVRMLVSDLLIWILVDRLIGLYQHSIEKIEDVVRRLKVADRAKSDFLANISHEIRTPLNGIFGSLQVIKGESQNPEVVHRYTDVAMGSYRSVVGIVNDLLDLAKITAGKLNLVPEPINLSKLVYQAVAEAAPIAEAKNLEMKLTLSPDLTQGNRLSDGKALLQILRNLISNAIKFAEQGQVEVTLESSSDPDEITLRVRDTGLGIPSDKLQKIFDAFEQVDDSRLGERQGTGLGLSITSELVRLMEGQIDVESRVGEGSEFVVRVRLPLTDEQPIDEASQMSSTDLRPARLLLVEDVATNRMLFKALLKNAPYEIDLAVDGVEGVKAALQGDYDLVLMDIQMPRMDGFEALRSLQSVSYEVPVVACTANVMKEDIQAYSEAGFVDVIGKPYLKAELIKLIESARRNRSDVQ